MVKATLIATQPIITIEIPQNYIGKKIEVLYYAVDELTENEPPKKKLGEMRGRLNLTEQQYNDFQTHVKNSRDEWDSNTIN